jgi:O-antigen/teichoic acid export membrane protein
VGTGIARLGSLAAAVIVARSLGRADLGRYAAIAAIGAIVVSGPGGGLPIMAIRDVASGRAGRSFASHAARAELLVTAIASCLGILAVMVIVGGKDAAQLGLVVGLGNMTLVQVSLATSLGLGLKLHSLVIGLQVAQGVLLPMATLVAVHFGLGLPGALGAFAIAGIPCATAGFWALRDPLRRLSGDSDNRHLFWRSKSFLGLGAVNGGYQRVDSVVTLAAAGAIATGTYASAYRVLGPFDLLEAGFAQVFYPRLSAMEAGTAAWDAIRRRATLLYTFVVVPPAALAFILMPLIILTLFGPTFRSSITPARILMLSLVPGALYWPDALALSACGRESVVLFIFLISTVLDVVLVIVLAGRWGATGAAWAWVVTELSLWLGVKIAIRSQMVRRRGESPT